MNKMKREQISALADSELTDNHVDAALVALRQVEEREVWDIYHQIGDVLRSNEMAITLRPDFAARMAARLESEQTIIAPVHPAVDTSLIQPAPRRRALKKLAVPGMIAAAAAAVALMAAPPLMVAKNESPAIANEQIMIASAAKSMTVSHTSVTAPALAKVRAASDATREGVVLRDPRIDEYLLAHQRFSPSLYSTAQYARSATFATDSDK